MRKILGVAFAAALISVPVGLAVPPAGHTPTPAGHKTSPTRHGAKPCPKPPRHGVKYIIRGIVSTEVAPDPVTGDPTFMLDVTSVNAHAKKALAGPTARGGGAYDALIPVTIDRCTFITKNKTGSRRRTTAVLKVGDRVIVGWKAKRGTAYLSLGAADRIVDRGPVPVPAT